MTDALHLTPREVAQVEAALDLTSAEQLAAAAIVAAEADERGMRHWTDLADRLTAEAARQVADRPERISRDRATDDDWIDWAEDEEDEGDE